MKNLTHVMRGVVACSLLFVLGGCDTTVPGTYRGGVLVQPGPLDIQDHYTFNLVDKWRISHAWLSGPVDIWPCHYSNQREDRLIEVNGLLTQEYTSESPKDKGTKRLSQKNEWVYGTNTRTGEFEGYKDFCWHGFTETGTGVSVMLIKPDPAKGTDRWIEGAKPLMVNGLHWLRKAVPLEDRPLGAKGGQPVERWVLKIPETPYWFVMQLGSPLSGSHKNPALYARILTLFHEMVASVQMQRITPMAPPP